MSVRLAGRWCRLVIHVGLFLASHDPTYTSHPSISRSHLFFLWLRIWPDRAIEDAQCRSGTPPRQLQAPCPGSSPGGASACWFTEKFDADLLMSSECSVFGTVESYIKYEIRPKIL